MQQVNNIRFLMSTENNYFREILKLRLAINKKDFYLSRRDYLKISFHDNGVVVGVMVGFFAEMLGEVAGIIKK